MILLAHPTGNAFSRALLEALLTRRELGLFATTIALHGEEAWLKLLPRSVRSELLRRRFAVPAEKLLTRPARELWRLATGRLGRKAGVGSIYRDLDRFLGEKLPFLAREHQLTAVYAYEDGACDLFKIARDLGLKCIYDLPIAYWEKTQELLRFEAQLWPEWKQTMPALNDSAEKLARKTEELKLADLVVCPSKFVADSLPSGWPCIVSEFGSPPRTSRLEVRAVGKKIRILFGGSMTQRKGLADLFAAMKLFKREHFELVVMGSPLAPMEFYRRQFADFVYEPPRPHAEVLKLMETCDVLVLPSIVEGRALALQEAMSRGLIVIATPNAGAQDLLEDETAGFLVPIRSPESIAERLSWMADNRAALPDMKRAAYEKAAALTWQRYADKILDAIARIGGLSHA